MNNRWNEYLQKLRGQHKKIFILSALTLVGLLLVIYDPGEEEPPGGGDPPGAGPTPINEQNIRTGQDKQGMEAEEQEMAKTLEVMLSAISGVGKVRASVELATSTNSNYSFNTEQAENVTEETDQSGGTRTTTETNAREQLVLVQGSQGSESPVTEQEIAPNVAGVMIIAEGASEPEVKARLFQAVQISLGVDPHKVIVLPMERGAN
ncbi:MAG: hypothetical protein FH756_09675 [Firmicutes bacterium]|nr:hypothetical protein [Bacillota bacterium]